MNNFWCITPFFNPAKYKSLLYNYNIFSEKLKQQKINLLTVELAFGEDPFQIPDSENVLRLRGNSIMWQKERLINHAISQLPSSCEYIGWLDCDILFSDDNWVNLAIEKLKKNPVVQLYKKVFHLPKGHFYYQGEHLVCLQSVIWQYKIHKNWLQRRKDKELPFSTPGFAWAARKSFYEDIGIYDKNIIGSGDTFLVDCYLDSWDIHGFASKFNLHMKKDMLEWIEEFKKKKFSVDYIPVDIYHLWHGSLKNRRYMDRHDFIKKYDYDPRNDIKIINNVYEWSSDKIRMHEEIKDYFFGRLEDEENE